jgi:DNA topoisomerase-2
MPKEKAVEDITNTTKSRSPRKSPGTERKWKAQKLTTREHALLRPDMYIGSVDLEEVEEYVARKVDGKYQIGKETITASPGLLRIFIEILSNAIDNVWRSKKTKTPVKLIDIWIDEETGETRIWNDGMIIPIELDEENECYNHTLVFGTFLTGTNYEDDDEEERITSGRNGVGSKATCVFSERFTVKGCDPQNNKSFEQTWTENMKETTGPLVDNTKMKKGFTEVVWTPDFARFGLKGYTPEVLAMYTRYIIDTAMLTKVEVKLNGEVIDTNNLESYARLYSAPTEEMLIVSKQADMEVVLTSANDAEHISFVNGIFTKLGGKHVDAWTKELFDPIVQHFSVKDKKTGKLKPQVSLKEVKQFFRLFVVSIIDKPKFDGQEKNMLKSPNVEANVLPKQIKSLLKWEAIDNIEDLIRAKGLCGLKKQERKKTGYVKIDKLDPANLAGGKRSNECALCLCEGDSAATYVAGGVDVGFCGVAGKDFIGIYALRGKPLNVRDCNDKKIEENQVITNVVRALGLRYGVDYAVEKEYKTLQYGKVVIVADADVDGLHIEGLLLNFFHALFPSLLAREQPYISSMKTPIVKVMRPRAPDILFYDERKYLEYCKNQTTSVKAKYYKGLGSLSSTDIPATFGAKMVEYVIDDNTAHEINKVFRKKYADARKQWLDEYDPLAALSLDDEAAITQMVISRFFNDEMIKFSISDCERSLPNLMDGLKESQRKILYAAKLKNLKYKGESLKVAQFGGFVAEKTKYHHGEDNLHGTIIKMAQAFVGSNNIPLFFRDGQFGSRRKGGKDTPSPRYIHTTMDYLTHLIFPEADDKLLTYRYEDNYQVEPEYYTPIIPMILCNGANGVGTGWSSDVPCFNPLDLCRSIHMWLDMDGDIFEEDEQLGRVCHLPELTPWYRGFKGIIEKDNNRFITRGICERGDTNNTAVITELPIGKWTLDFKDDCEKALEDKKLKDMRDLSSDTNVHFILTETTEGIKCNHKTLDLQKYLSVSNMVMYDTKGQIIKYKDTSEIIHAFCQVRLECYVKRREHILQELQIELRRLGNKERFVREVVNEELIIMKVPENEVVQELETREYDKDEKESYDYLLRMQIRTFTTEKIEQLQNDILSTQEAYESALAVTAKDMWKNELKIFEKEYKKWLPIIEEELAKGKKGAKAKKTKGGKKK